MSANNQSYLQAQQALSESLDALRDLWLHAAVQRDGDLSLACLQVSMDGDVLKDMGGLHSKTVFQGKPLDEHDFLDLYRVLGQNDVHITALGLCAFDNGGYRGREPLPMPAHQRQGLLDVVCALKYQQFHEVALISSVMCHVHDKQFWRDLVQRQPDWANEQRQWRSYRAARSADVHYNAMTCALSVGNSQAYEALHDAGCAPCKNVSSVCCSILDSGLGFRTSTSKLMSKYVQQPQYLDALLGAIIEEGRHSVVKDLMLMHLKTAFVAQHKEQLDAFIQNHGDYVFKRITRFGRQQNRGPELSDLVNASLMSGHHDLYQEMQLKACRLNVDLRPSPLNIHADDASVSIEQFRQSVREFAEQGFHLNGVSDHSKQRTHAHTLYGDEQKRFFGVGPQADAIIKQRIVALIDEGLDMQRKDSRGWTAWSYLPKPMAQEIKSMLKARDAKEMLKDIASELRQQLR